MLEEFVPKIKGIVKVSFANFFLRLIRLFMFHGFIGFTTNFHNTLVCFFSELIYMKTFSKSLIILMNNGNTNFNQFNK